MLANSGKCDSIKGKESFYIRLFNSWYEFKLLTKLNVVYMKRVKLSMYIFECRLTLFHVRNVSMYRMKKIETAKVTGSGNTNNYVIYI